MEIIIAEGKTAVNYELILAKSDLVNARAGLPVTIWAWGLGAEEIDLEVPNRVNPVLATDAHWMVLKVGGTDVALTAGTPYRVIDFPVHLRIKKPITAADSGVALMR